MIALDLTGQPYTCQSLLTQSGLLGLRHARRFAAHEFHPARRAARVPSTCVQDVNSRILLDRIDETLAILHINSRKSFNGQLGHARYVNVSSRA